MRRTGTPSAAAACSSSRTATAKRPELRAQEQHAHREGRHRERQGDPEVLGGARLELHPPQRRVAQRHVVADGPVDQVAVGREQAEHLGEGEGGQGEVGALELVAQREEADERREQRGDDGPGHHADPRRDVVLDEQPDADVGAQAEVGGVAEAEHPAEAAHDVPADRHDREDQHADRDGLLGCGQEQRDRHEHDGQHGDDDEVASPHRPGQRRRLLGWRRALRGERHAALPNRPWGRRNSTSTKTMKTDSSGLCPGR